MLPLTQQMKKRHYLFSLTLALSVIFLMPFMAFASTITVNTTDDEFGTGAGCSLREAIESANTNTAFGGCATAGAVGMDTVNVPTGIYTLTIMNQGEDLNATGDLDVYGDVGGITLSGTGVVSSDVIIDANSIDRVIHGLVALNLNNLTIKGGYEAYGGGAYFTLAASVTRTIFSGNTSGLNSGGAYFDSTASVMETTFSDNTASNDGGGAIFNSTASVTGTTFRGNSTTFGSGSGGATFNSTASVMGTTFMSNTATSGSGGAYFTLAASVTDSAFMSNTTTSGGNGGGAYFGDTVSVMGTTFSGNSAANGGGAVFGGTTSMTGTTFNGNTASSSGGGAWFWSTASVMGATFSGNTAGFGGGAMFGGTTSVTGTTFNGNTASNNGGGAYFVDAASVTGTTFNGNTALFGGGGAWFDGTPANRLVVNVLFSRNRTSSFYGAAIYVQNASPLSLIHTTIVSPTAPTGGTQAVYVQAGTVYLTNTIIASHTTGIQQAAGTVVEDYNLFYGNGADTGGTVTSGGNSLTGLDPLFTAPMSDDYHLLSGSPASGLGIPLGILTDYDGDARSATAPASGYDEEGGMPTLSIANGTTLENSGSLLFTVTLSVVSADPVTFTYQTQDGTATTADSDYTAIVPTQGIIPAGSLSMTVTVDITGDSKYELNETVGLSLSNVLSATVATGIATGTIQNDDIAPIISIADSTELENNGALLFMVTLDATSTLPITVTYQTVDDTATTADSDYTGIGVSQLLIPAGSLSQIITVTVTGDTKYETDETMVVNLTSPVNATLAVTQAIGTIQNDDTAPTMSIADGTGLENNGSLLFIVTLSAVSALPVTVTYQTADGTATTADSDYTAIGATQLVIPAGELSKTITVTLIGDSKFEADETMFVNLSSPVNVTLAMTQATGTIQNDETGDCYATPDNGTTVYFGNNASAVRSALGAVSAGGTVKVAGYCKGAAFQGGDNQVALITQTITLAGGYTATNWSTYNPTGNPTTLDALGVGRVIVANVAATLQGFTATNGRKTTADGGGLYALGALTLTQMTVYSNRSNSASGGGAYFLSAAIVTGTTFSNNIAGSSGGGASFLGTAIVTGTTFSGNLANLRGGGASFASTASVMRTTFSGNRATFGGGAIFGGASAKQLVNVLFSRNRATTNGAEIYVDDAAPLKIIHTTIASPTLVSNQAVYVAAGTVYITNSIIASHTIGISRTAGTVVEDYNLFYGNGANTGGTVTSGGNSLTGQDPKFTDPASDDYHLLSGSPASGLGIPLGILTDYDGDARSATAPTPGYDEVGGMPTISIANGTTLENSGSLLFTVTLSAVSLNPVTVTYQTVDGTATTADSDYTAIGASQLLIPAGSLSQTITVTVTPDTKYEADETLVISLTNPLSATFAISQATGTIQNDDSAPIISMVGESALENNASLLFTVTLDAASALPITVTYQTVDGTATTADSDYTAIGATQLLMPAGSLSQTITVTVTGDTNFEADETMLVNLTSPVSATLAVTQATGTIQNDDSAPAISIVGESALENNGSLLFTVTLNAASALPITVTYQTADGTATITDSDYTAIGATQLFMPAGSLSQTITVTVTGDTQFEVDETMLISLTNPLSATLAISQATGTIQNDDTAPTISIADSLGLENNGALLFTVTLSTISGAPVTVTYQTADGTATTADNDYTALGATPLLIPAGSSSQTITITLTGDSNFESDETMLVNLTSPVNATLAVTQATGTIQNDDTMPTISIADSTGLENNGTLLFTVTLSAMSSFPVTVTYQTADGTATTADNDYIAIGATQLVILAGSSAATFNVTLTGDSNIEVNEIMLINLTSPVSATILDNQAIGTIQNDDLAPTPTPTNTPMPTATSTPMPTPTSTPAFSTSQNITYTYAITAADAESNVLTLSAPTLPSWLTFIDNGNGTALLSGSPTLSNGGTIGNHNVVLRVSDTVSTTQQAFVIAVVSPTLLSGRAGPMKAEKVYLPILLRDR